MNRQRFFFDMNDIKDFLQKIERIFEEEQFVHQPEELYAPIDYTLRLGGKRIRPTLLMVANAMFGGDESQVRDAAIGIETFHNFTLLHDDLMDRSPLRRGQPTVYRKWNENTAILSGDTMFALAWRYFLRQPSPRLREVLDCFNETAIEVCEGQQYDMNFEKRNLVGIDEYMLMIRKKTAVLLAGALKIGALYAGAPAADIERLYQFGIHMGLSFQLQDDLLDAYGDVAVFGKQTGQDIRDNKKTFLPLRALELANEAQKAELLSLFGAAGVECGEEEKVRRVLAVYDQVDVRRDVEKIIAQEDSAAIGFLEEIALPADRKKPLYEMMEMLKGRKK